MNYQEPVGTTEDYSTLTTVIPSENTMLARMIRKAVRGGIEEARQAERKQRATTTNLSNPAIFPRFRAWHKTHKKMYYFVEYTSYADGSTSISTVGNGYGDCFAVDADDIELMLCTDYKDCRGVNIWQGDILENYHSNSELAIVSFGEHKLYVDGVYVNCTGFHTNHGGYEHYDGLSSETIRDDTRVVGNIHENSELLGVQS